MDQTNPLAELTHKRRLSALGPGGLRRERAGFDVRDVHNSPLRPHLPDRDAGRPEHRPDRLAGDLRPDQRVRLHRDALPQGAQSRRPTGPRTWSATCCASASRCPTARCCAASGTQDRRGAGRAARIARRRAARGARSCRRSRTTSSTCRPTRKTATRSRRRMRPWTRTGHFTESRVSVRRQQKFLFEAPDHIEYMDVSPKQIVSVSAALIPFLEHDDANRALMGSNMQRQAVPAAAAGGARSWAPASSGRPRVDSARWPSPQHPGEVVKAASDEVIVLEDDGTRRTLPAAQVPALEPEHVHRPAPGRPEGRPGGEGPGAGRLHLDRAWARWRWARTCWWPS